METLENADYVPPLTKENSESHSVGKYEAVRFNALQHGILSRYTVLPHEDGNEYETLLTDLVNEHKPVAITEAHLVEELAGIIWRKRRVLQAEGASINAGLKGVIKNAGNVVTTAAPFEFGLSGEGTDLRDLVGMTPDDVAERQREVQFDLEATKKAAALLRKGNADAYLKALKALTQDSRDWWNQYLEDEEYQANAEGLSTFIREQLEPLLIAMEKESKNHEAIKSQALGEGLQVYRLEKLARYETHLDRKFERSLAMLIKLKDLRGT